MALLGLDNQFSGALNAGYSSGLAKGMLAAKEDNREERKLGMAEEEFGWKREAVEKEKLLQAGMADAAKDGGYEAVISYLEKADPERAISFTSAKTKLDAQIMNNDVMKNIKIPEMRQDALLESYSKLGKMGAAILQLPEDQRDEAYKAMLPIAKVINPDMPDNLQQAAPVLLLAAAQATPTNQLFKANKDQYQAQSNVGRLGQDIEAYRKAGVVPGDGTAEGDTLSSLLADRDRWRNQSVSSALSINKTQLSQEKDQNAATQQVSKNLASQSLITPNYIQAYTSMNSAFDVLGKDPTNAQAMQQLARSFVKMNVGSVASDLDSGIAYGAAGFEGLKLKAESYLSGQAVPLNATDIANLRSIVTTVNDKLIQSQKNIETQFENSVQGFGDLVQWQNVIKPSEYFNQQQQNAASNNIAANGQLPPELQQAISVAKSRGYSEEQINQTVNRYMQQKAQAAQQQNQLQLTPQDYGNE